MFVVFLRVKKCSSQKSNQGPFAVLYLNMLDINSMGIHKSRTKFPENQVLQHIIRNPLLTF